MLSEVERTDAGAEPGARREIPIENLWFLLVYAAGLAQFHDRFAAEVRDCVEVADLFGRLLCFVVERRLRRNLSRAYHPKSADLTRVRGRIDWLRTETHQLLQQGRVACLFEDLIVDTPRNRLVRAALDRLAGQIAGRETADRCATLSGTLGRLGVSSELPSRSERARDQIGRNEAEDRLMVTVADLALDLILPSEAAGTSPLTSLERDEVLLRSIFEKAVAGLYRHALEDRGWNVQLQKGLYWTIADPTPGLAALLPQMRTDLVLDGPGASRRIVLDTKFTNVLRPRWHGGESFKSEYLYQLYTYLCSQANLGNPVADAAEGVLLHPAVSLNVDEAVTIQGHRIRFATVDLSRPAEEIKERLLDIVLGQ